MNYSGTTLYIIIVFHCQFGTLTTLKTLWLDDNEFEVFPSCVCQLKQLKVLRLSGNSIKSIPSLISTLENLETLVTALIQFVLLILFI